MYVLKSTVLLLVATAVTVSGNLFDALTGDEGIVGSQVANVNNFVSQGKGNKGSVAQLSSIVQGGTSAIGSEGKGKALDGILKSSQKTTGQITGDGEDSIGIKAAMDTVLNIGDKTLKLKTKKTAEDKSKEKKGKKKSKKKTTTTPEPEDEDDKEDKEEDKQDEKEDKEE